MRYAYWFWENLLPITKIKKINKLIQLNSFIADDGKAQYAKKTATTKTIKLNHLRNLLQEELDKLLNINRLKFGFTLYPLLNSKNCLYHTYDSKDKGQYNWHIDGSKDEDNFDIKLTALINLSEKKFEGGDLKLFVGKVTKVNEFKNSGSMIIFKSNILHKVSPVIKGKRNTLTILLEGPRFI